MAKHREVFDVLQSLEYAEASAKLATLLGADGMRDADGGVGARGVGPRSFLEEVGLDGWATEDRYGNGYYTLAG